MGAGVAGAEAKPPVLDGLSARDHQDLLIWYEQQQRQNQKAERTASGGSKKGGGGFAGVVFSAVKDSMRKSQDLRRTTSEADALKASSRFPAFAKSFTLANSKKMLTEMGSWTSSFSSVMPRFKKRKDESVHGFQKTVLDTESQTVGSQWLPKMNFLHESLRECCEATGFAYGEVWLRVHRYEQPDYDPYAPGNMMRRTSVVGGLWGLRTPTSGEDPNRLSGGQQGHSKGQGYRRRFLSSIESPGDTAGASVGGERRRSTEGSVEAVAAAVASPVATGSNAAEGGRRRSTDGDVGSGGGGGRRRSTTGGGWLSGRRRSSVEDGGGVAFRSRRRSSVEELRMSGEIPRRSAERRNSLTRRSAGGGAPGRQRRMSFQGLIPSVASMGAAGEESMALRGGEEGDHLSRRLRWISQSYTNTQKFTEGEKAGLLKSGWQAELEHFKKQAEGEFRWYEKGKGFPGMAWARKELDWCDLASLAEDDDLAADPRVITAKGMFCVSVGIPILEPETNILKAVTMLYLVHNVSGGREINKNVRQLRKNENLVNILNQYAKYSFWCLCMSESIDDISALLSEHLDVQGPNDTVLFSSSRKGIEDLDVSVPEGWTGFLYLWVSQYLGKFKGQQDHKPPAGHDLRFSLFSAFGTFIGIFAITSIDNRLREVDYYGTNPPNPAGRNFYPVLLINSMGAVAGMLFAAPTSPLGQPRPVILGHVIAAVSAISVDHLSNPQHWMLIPQWVATPLAPALAIGIMSKFGLIHPPSCAAAVIYMMGTAEIKNLGWMYIVVPVLFDCVMLIILALLINNLSRARSYPTYW